MVSAETARSPEIRRNASCAFCGAADAPHAAGCRCSTPAGTEGCRSAASETPGTADPVRVLIVDDSELIRRALRKILASGDGIEVIAEAADGSETLKKLERLRPDVITLDVHMPGMDGLSTLKRIMIRSPRPTLMLSGLTLEGAKLTFDSLRYGAVDFLPKPSNLGGTDCSEQRREIIRRVRLAAGVEIEAVRYFRKPERGSARLRPVSETCRRLVMAGAAEGGYAALLKMVPGLPSDLPAACVVVLYADPRYVDAFAAYLDEFSAVRVRRAANGMPLQHGSCYLVAGCEYATLQNGPRGPVLAVNPSPFRRRRGSVNMLMFSAAEAGLQSMAGVLLSGAGEDGVEGAGVVLRSGGRILVQDPVTCLYKQMTARAIAAHGEAITAVVPDLALADEIPRSVA